LKQKEWDELVNKNSSKFYHLYEWGDLLNRVHGHRLFYLEEEEGVFPLALVKSRIFGNRLISLPFADYAGPCTNSLECANSLIHKSEKIAEDLNIDYIEIRSPDKPYFDVFLKHGFVQSNDYFTYIINLSHNNLETIWTLIGNKNRNMIRKAQKNQVEIVDANSEFYLDIFYGLYLDTMKRLGSPPQPYTFFKIIWSLFYPSRIKLILTEQNGKYLSGSLFLLHKDIIQYAYNCSSKDVPILGQNNLIVWSIIKYAKENDFNWFDFGRTRENAGNVLFKSRWGGKCYKMSYFYKFYKKQLKERDEIKYRNLSDLWSKYMPKMVADALGPRIIRQIG